MGSWVAAGSVFGQLSIRNSPEQPAIVICEPDGAMPDAHRITAATNPLVRHLVGSGVDTCERNVEYGCPDRVFAIADVPTGTGYSCLNRGRHFPALRVNPANGSVSL